jgi:hypothetical protein
MEGYMALNRLPEPEAAYKDAETRHLEAGLVQNGFYLLAFLRGDAQAMAKMTAALSNEPGFEIMAIREQADTAAYYGLFRATRELTSRMRDGAA